MTLWTVVLQVPLSMGILQARILEWVVISFSRYLPDPGIEPVSPALAGQCFTTEPLGKSLVYISLPLSFPVEKAMAPHSSTFA